MLTLALPTGRSLESCIEILEDAGLPTERLKNAGRNLVVGEADFRYLLSKPSDIPALVCHGAAELALVGNDVTEETGVALTELLDTGRGKCFMAIAGPPDVALKFNGQASALMGLKVATKYERLADRTFSRRGVQIRVLKLNGSVELAPALGLADCIFDVVQTGGTLRANGLSVIEKTLDVSLRLVAGRASVQLNWKNLFKVADAISSAAGGA